MEFFKNKKEFADLVQLTSEYKGIPEQAIEKDYLICKILSNLAQSKYVQHCVFKGGTSLSKCYPGSIERFSEDIDLTYLPLQDVTKNALNKELKKIEMVLIGECTSEPITAERNDKNKCSQVWLKNMPKKTGIKLEIGAVVRPEPYEMRPIKSYIHEFLEERGLAGIIEEYKLQTLSVNVLDIRRTFIDKLLAVKRHAICGTLHNKVRHIYDVKKLLEQNEIREFLQDTEELKRIIQLTKDTDTAYLGKRISAKDYNPLGAFSYETWKDILANSEIQKRYESLHKDLLYTSEQQVFSDALKAFADIDNILTKIGV